MSTATAEAFSISPYENNRDDISKEGQTAFLSADELKFHLRQCASNDRVSQKKIYHSFYSYAKAICDLYAKRNDDALEIVNDSFLKVFKELYRYKPAYTDVISSFKGWLRRIVIHTAIDHFRKNQKHHLTRDLPEVISISTNYETALDHISYQEIIQAIQQLSPAYRTSFNLYIIEGLTHIEISKLLSITVGASKSNLSKAKRQLRKILFQRNQMADLAV